MYFSTWSKLFYFLNLSFLFQLASVSFTCWFTVKYFNTYCITLEFIIAHRIYSELREDFSLFEKLSSKGSSFFHLSQRPPRSLLYFVGNYLFLRRHPCWSVPTHPATGRLNLHVFPSEAHSMSCCIRKSLIIYFTLRWINLADNSLMCSLPEGLSIKI